jgi:L-glutamine:2-deoxy-scyllo-inosose/3-amino-2,3-dideoxy-scyllo-inosose aminotransferase
MATTMTMSGTGLALTGGSKAGEGIVAPAWPPIDDATANRLVEVYRSRQWSFGGEVEKSFAKNYAAYHGAKHGIFMVNGTVTLQAALIALGVGAGDEVIVPGLTWLATAMAVYYVGATPVFVDIEPTTLCIDPAKFEAAITPKTKAVIPVHLYGGLADLDAILAIARRRGLKVIEDCAHMQGGKWAGRGVGSWGDVGSFSFQQSKTLAAGEAGICLTNDDTLAERLYRIKHIGYAEGQKAGKATDGPPAGLICHNFRATDFAAVILEGQLVGLDALIKRYVRNASYLEQRVAEVSEYGVRVQSRGRRADPQGYYAFLMIADRGPIADVPMPLIWEACVAEGLTTVTGTYGPVYKHALWSLPPSAYRIAEGGCPVADGIASNRVFGFMHMMLGADEQTIERVGDVITKVVRHTDELKELAKTRG